MRRPVAFVVLALGSLACAPRFSSAVNPFITDHVWVIAHQGGEGLWPSNTMYAFDRAVKIGADMRDPIRTSVHGINTDRPDLLMRVLGRTKSEHRPARASRTLSSTVFSRNRW